MFSDFTRPFFFFSICFVLTKRWHKCVNRRKCLLIRVLLFVCYYSACSHCNGVVNLLRVFNMQSHATRTVEHGLAVTNRLFSTCSLVLEKHSSTNRSSFFCLGVYTFVLCGEPFYFPLCSSNLYLIFTSVLISWCASLICFFLNFFFFAHLCWFRYFPLLLLSVSHNLYFCSYNITISSRVLLRAVFYCITQSPF